MNDPPTFDAPPEPAGLRVSWRAGLLDGEPWAAAGGELLVDHLWAAWSDHLEARRADRGFLADVVTGYRRELWLWMLGDRRWEPVIDALAGRVARRLVG